MTMLIAFVRPDLLSDIQAALDRTVSCFVSATPMESHGPEPTMAGSYRAAKFRVRRTRLRLDIAVDDAFAAAAAKAVANAVSQNDGDWTPHGEVFVVRTDDFLGVRFGS